MTKIRLSQISKDLDINADEKIFPSVLSKDIDVYVKIDKKKRKFQKRLLTPIINFFITTNIVILVVIGLCIFVEFIFLNKNPGYQRIVNEKVLMVAISAIAVQTAAIIIAAFKGLFR